MATATIVKSAAALTFGYLASRAVYDAIIDSVTAQETARARQGSIQSNHLVFSRGTVKRKGFTLHRSEGTDQSRKLDQKTKVTNIFKKIVVLLFVGLAACSVLMFAAPEFLSAAGLIVVTVCVVAGLLYSFKSYRFGAVVVSSLLSTCTVCLTLCSQVLRLACNTIITAGELVVWASGWKGTEQGTKARQLNNWTYRAPGNTYNPEFQSRKRFLAVGVGFIVVFCLLLVAPIPLFYAGCCIVLTLVLFRSRTRISRFALAAVYVLKTIGVVGLNMVSHGLPWVAGTRLGSQVGRLAVSLVASKGAKHGVSQAGSGSGQGNKGAGNIRESHTQEVNTPKIYSQGGNVQQSYIHGGNIPQSYSRGANIANSSGHGDNSHESFRLNQRKVLCQDKSVGTDICGIDLELVVMRSGVVTPVVGEINHSDLSVDVPLIRATKDTFKYGFERRLP